MFALSLPWGHKPFIAINNICVMLLAANWLAEAGWKEKWQLLKADKLALSFIGYFAFYGVSLLYSSNVGAGLFVLEKKLSLLALPLIMSTSRPLKLPEVKMIFKLFIASCFVSTVYCLCWAIGMNYSEGYTASYVYDALVHDIHRPGYHDYLNFWYFSYKLLASPVAMHPIYLSMYVILASSASVWLWWQKGSTGFRMVFYACILLNFLFVVLLSSRTQLFCAVLIVTGYWLYYSYKKARLLRGVIVIGLLYGLVLMFVLTNPLIRERILVSSLPGTHFSKNEYGAGGMSLRMYKWKYAFETFKRHPLFGAGAGDGQEELVRVYQENNFQIGVKENFNPHNQLLQSAIDTGLCGVIVLMFVFIESIRKAAGSRNPIYLLFVCLFFASCITESMLEVNKGVAFFSFFSAVLGCSYLRVVTAQTPAST